MYSEDHKDGSGMAIVSSEYVVLGDRLLCAETHKLTDWDIICVLKIEVM